MNMGKEIDKIELKKSEDSDELVLQIPKNIMDGMGWHTGDNLVIEAIEKGMIVLSKKDQNH